MLNYRDMTFCEAKECANFARCPRALTERVWEAARKADLPICQFSEPTKLPCYKEPQSSGGNGESVQ